MPILKTRYQIVVNALGPTGAPECAQTKETERTESKINTVDKPTFDDQNISTAYSYPTPFSQYVESDYFQVLSRQNESTRAAVSDFKSKLGKFMKSQSTLPEVKESLQLALGATAQQVEQVWPLIWNEEELDGANELICLI